MNNLIIMMSFVLFSLVLMNAATDMVSLPGNEIFHPPSPNTPTAAENNTNQTSEINSTFSGMGSNIVTENSEKIAAVSAPINIETTETPNSIQYDNPSNDYPVIEAKNETIGTNETNNDTENSEDQELIPLADVRSSNDYD